MQKNLSELSDFAERVKGLLESISVVSPGALPDLDVVLSDAMIVSLLKAVYSIIDQQALEVARVNNGWWDNQGWLIDCISEDSSDAEILALIQQDIDYSGGEGLNGIRFEERIFDWDSWDASLDNGFIDLPHCLLAWDVIGNVNLRDLFTATLGNKDGVGVLSLSLGPFMGSYKQAIQRWDTPKKALAGVARLPILANIAFYYIIPGLWPNAFMGAAEKNASESSTFWVWENLPILLDQFKQASAVYKLEVKEEDCTPTWLFEQTTMIFDLRSWPEVSFAK